MGKLKAALSDVIARYRIYLYKSMIALALPSAVRRRHLDNIHFLVARLFKKMRVAQESTYPEVAVGAASCKERKTAILIEPPHL